MVGAPTKILFLDVDGVLNDAQILAPGIIEMHPRFICNLERIITETKCNIVVSSSWRMGGLGKKSYFQAALKRGCVDLVSNRFVVFNNHRFELIMGSIIGGTPIKILNSDCRGDEICMWLQEHNFNGNFVIVDDEEDMGPYTDRLVKTKFCGPDGETGLTTQHTNRIITMLNG